MRKKILKFATEESGMPKIIPSKTNIPQWYKDTEGYNYGNIEFNGDYVKKNLKHCMPFFDSLTSGYTVELWCDVYFEAQPDGTHYIKWGRGGYVDSKNNLIPPIDFRNNKTNDRLPVPPGCEPSHYIWQFPYFLKTPPGYSLLMTHPINRFDLPFITLTGIVDADSTVPTGNLPFFIKAGFSGIVPKGTPILQIIPFKRESWTAERDDEIIKEGNRNKFKTNSVFFGYYKKTLWHKKNYE